MSVAVRLSRLGRKNSPIYRVVVKDSRSKRDGAFIENLGTYNPITHQIFQFNDERVNYWLSKGAIVSDAVIKIQKMYKKQGLTLTQVAS
ncbi:MAG: 30S ribosomal protein S16 [Candidatus Babeliales bacterium]|nr:30S ribosomal protein S16 [Candidatus Babeliales bacterium]